MRGVNKVILVGSLGHDVEVRKMNNGNSVANIRIATNERWTRRDTGSVQEHTEWHNVVLFGRRAELAEQYAYKGSRLFVEGRLRTRKWQDREGNDRRSTEIVADDVQFIRDRDDKAPQTSYRDDDNYGNRRDDSAARTSPSKASAFEGEVGSSNDDDPPF